MATSANTMQAILLALGLVLFGCAQDQNGGIGRAGSTARFSIQGNYLYTIKDSEVQLYNIVTPATPIPHALLNVAFGIETLFQHGNYLLIGANDGLYIYDNTDPNNPEFKGMFSHSYACDPVVAQGNNAYVTLRGGNRCWNGSPTLIALDISDISNPQQTSETSMQNPYGLAIDGNKLFVCDGIAGLKLFDITNPAAPSLQGQVHDQSCNDLIAANSVLVVTSNQQLIQIDYSNTSNLPLPVLSTITTQPQ